MEIQIQNQLINILYSLLLGLIFGAGYDIIRIVQMMLIGFRLRTVLVFLIDLMFMAVICCGVSVFCYAFEHGRWRLYVLLSMGTGFTVYLCTIGRIVMFFSDALIRWLRVLFHYAVVKPIRFLLRQIRAVFCRVFRCTVKVIFCRIADAKRKRYTERQKRMLKNLVCLRTEGENQQ